MGIGANVAVFSTLDRLLVRLCPTPSRPPRVVAGLNTRANAVSGSKVLTTGVAYDRDIDDRRESQALDVMTMLRQRGAVVSYADPNVPNSMPVTGRAASKWKLGALERCSRSTASRFCRTIARFGTPQS